MMKRAFLGMILMACGGASTTDIDGGTDSGGDSTVNDSGSGNDTGNGNDTGTGNDTGPGTDGGCGDGGCAQFTTDCGNTKCATNEVCVMKTSGVQTTHQCYPLPTCGCSGKSMCECVGACACGNEQCQNSSSGVSCVGPVSRREFKTDISYVSDEEQKELARETLQTNLAEYRYKTEPESSKRHLGFIIDDMPAGSPAVQGDGTHVDLYGYTTMLLATVKEQQKQIDTLQKQVDELKRK
jgi:hypothetical protein